GCRRPHPSPLTRWCQRHEAGPAAPDDRCPQPRPPRRRRADAAWAPAGRRAALATWAVGWWRLAARSWGHDATTGHGPAQDQVVAVDGLVVLVVAQEVGQLAGVPAGDAPQVGGRVVREPDGEALALTLDGHGVAEGEVAAHAHDAARQQAPARPERVAGAGVDLDDAGHRLVEDPRLAAGHAAGREEALADLLAARQRREARPSPAHDDGLDAGVGGDPGGR